MGSQKPTQDKSCILWKRETDFSEDQEEKNPYVRKVVYKRGRLKHDSLGIKNLPNFHFHAIYLISLGMTLAMVS